MIHTLYLGKIIVAFLFVLVLSALVKAVFYGRKSKHDSLYISSHKYWATITVTLTVVSVVATEGFVRLFGGSTISFLFLFHLIVFALPYFVLVFVIRFFVTGERKPKTHRWLTYFVLVLYLGTFTTGMILLSQF